MDEPICDYNNCTGCGTCAGICPRECIALIPNKHKDGHIYPKIDQSSCIDCGLCVKTCPANFLVDFNHPTCAIASYVRDEDECIMSSSGGLAYAICRNTLNNGGIVYGAVINYGQNFSINHRRINNINDLKLTQGSKYVHSHIDINIFHELRNDIKSGLKVVFIGTGCQIAGIRNFLKKNYENLLTIDIICHGVPSQSVLTSYLKANNYIPSQIKQIVFRTKNNFGVYGVYGVNGEQINKPQRKSSYTMGFMKGLFYRDSCYNCRYATVDRCSDITLGDFWGLKHTIDEKDRKYKGTSLVLINTEKGNFAFSRIKSELVWETRPLEEAVNGNPQLRQPSKRHYAYNFFRLLYPYIGYRVIASITLIREIIFYNLALPFYYKYCEPLIYKIKYK